MNIPTWKPKQIDGSFDFSEENLNSALEEVKTFFLEYDGIVTLRKADDKIYFGAILNEQEILDKESNSTGAGVDESL